MNQSQSDDRIPPGVSDAGREFGGGYFYRARELLVDAADLKVVTERLKSGGRKVEGRPERIGGTGLVRLRLVDHVPTVVDELRAGGAEDERPVLVAPNHVLFGGSHMQPFPGSPPRPAPRPASAPRPPAGGSWPGCGVTVAVLDSGVVEGHPWLAGAPVSFGPGDVEQAEAVGGRLRRYAGHGTHVAGVVRCHAPGASILVLRLFGADGAVDDVTLAGALARLPREVGVVNLSLGGVTHSDLPPPATAAVLRDLAVKRPSLVVVAAAGNEGWQRPVWPAAFKRVVGVGALGPDGQRACFSNSGWWVDACAPATDVVSAFVKFKGDPEPVPVRGTCVAPAKPPKGPFTSGFAAWSGTSFAAPKVAAAVAAAMSMGLDGPEAVYRLVGDARLPRVADLGTVVDPPCHV